MDTGKLFHHEAAREEWADNHPVASAALATLTTAALTVAFAREALDSPRARNIVATAALGALTASGIVETIRPDTFRLWERMEARFSTE
jgi:hypothetical protein